MSGCQQSWSGRRQAGRVYKHLLDECQHTNDELKGKVRHGFSERTFHSQLERSEEAGSLENMSKAEANKTRGLKINQAILNFICGTGIPPTIVDTDEWKKLVAAIDASITTYASTSFVDTYIPSEATRITDANIAMLSKIKNLTIHMTEVLPRPSSQYTPFMLLHLKPKRLT